MSMICVVRLGRHFKFIVLLPKGMNSGMIAQLLHVRAAFCSSSVRDFDLRVHSLCGGNGRSYNAIFRIKIIIN